MSITPHSNVHFKAGCIKEKFSNWKSITSDPDILNTVTGCRIKFDKPIPSNNKFGRNQFSASEKVTISEEVQRLVEIEAIVKIPDSVEGFVSPIFTRPKKDGSVRMILNLKKLNESVEYCHFKMDTLEQVIPLITENTFMASIDLRNAYHSIPMHREDQKLLQFQFENQFYMYTCLPFGLSSAPRIFTKTLKPVLATLREMGHTVIAYIDDTIILADSLQECQLAIKDSVELFEKLGFVIHDKKSVLKPCYQLEFLGFMIDSVKMTITLTDSKKDQISTLCAQFAKLEKAKIREVATIIGKLIAACPGAEYGPMFCKTLEIEKSKALALNKGNFDSVMNITLEMQSCFNWWHLNVYSSVRHIVRKEPTAVLFSDASKTGWGCYIVNGPFTKGLWSQSESSSHINILELTAILLGISSLCSDYQDTHIRVMTDNTTAVNYINHLGGVKSPDCNKVAHKIWLWCVERRIWISAAYIKGTENTIADSLSRKYDDQGEWSLHQAKFNKIFDLYDTIEIDLFASRLNKKCHKFVSWLPDAEAFFIDAFTENWSKFMFYAFPPFALITKCLQKISVDRAHGILVLPVWPTQPWFQRALRMIIDTPHLIIPGKKILHLESNPTAIHPLHKSLTLMVLHVSGRDWRENSYLNGLPKSSYIPGAQERINSIKYISKSGRNFVVKGRLMNFKPL